MAADRFTTCSENNGIVVICFRQFSYNHRHIDFFAIRNFGDSEYFSIASIKNQEVTSWSIGIVRSNQDIAAVAYKNVLYSILVLIRNHLRIIKIKPAFNPGTHAISF